MKSDDIIVLLGAGASCEAGLKSSLQMTQQVEEKLEKNWKDYKSLYLAIKSSILYGHNLKGNTTTDLNIEEFVNVLSELERCDEHTIYPFIASWNMELSKYGGNDFCNIKKFKKAIVKELAEKWVNLKNTTDANYYNNLKLFAISIGTNLRIFSLNYDLCVERACGMDFVHRGFNENRIWDDRCMADDENTQHPLRLYKLHGSLDWRRNKNEQIYFEDNPSPCDDVEDYKLIFGTTYKLRYEDPFLFLISSLRRYALDAKLIICIGYSFGDDHINAILNRSFTRDENTCFVAVTKCDENKKKEEQDRISKILKVPNSNVILFTEGAKDFLQNHLTIDEMSKFIPHEQTPF